jgi:hypothetical protein
MGAVTAIIRFAEFTEQVQRITQQLLKIVEQHWQSVAPVLSFCQIWQ